jgi:hypothetical protein
MNDFSELENELKKLRPAQPSAGLFARVDQTLSESSAGEKIIRPDRFRVNWVSIGFGLAAAAVLLLFARVNMERRREQGERVSQVSPAPETSSVLPAPGSGSETGGSTSANAFIPAAVTQVVYNKRDEGLQFSPDSVQPRRRVSYQTQQTLQWHNRYTGASLRVSYPSEEVVLIPVSGQ